MFDASQVAQARTRIVSLIHRTPVITSASLDQLSGKNLFLKAENFQKTGSFKVRGALNAILHLVEQEGNDIGVVTHSSGNHGQALAYAAKRCGVKCAVVVPTVAPQPKQRAIVDFGARLVNCDLSMQARMESCARIAQDEGMKIISSHNNYDIIAGQGTAVMELLEEHPELDAILVPVSGGGLCSGTAAWAKHIKPSCKVFCVEPEGKRLGDSLAKGESVWDQPGMVTTVADGLRVRSVGDKCFPIIRENCEKTVFTVNDDQIIAAMKLVWERTKLLVEPSSATTVAAALSPEFKQLNVKNVGLMISGGNVDLDNLPWK